MIQRAFFRGLTRIHKWAGLVIGLQIVLWTGSGLFMTIFPIDQIRGRHMAAQVDAPINMDGLLNPKVALQNIVDDIDAVRLSMIAGQSTYIVSADGEDIFINAVSGEIFTGVSSDAIRRAAQTYYRDDAEILEQTLITQNAPIEFRGALPVWQVKFDDKAKTRLYLSTQTAELRSVRTRLWRVYDFMWMLHIMDYKSRDNFQTWWLRLAAAAAFLFALSGIGLVIHRVFLRPRSVSKLNTHN